MDDRTNTVKVGIGLFSGRPNPEFELADSEADRLLNLLRQVIGGEAIHPAPAVQLGRYYGFRVRLPDKLALQLENTHELTAYYGVVTSGPSEQSSHWRDSVGVELFLAELAIQRGFGALLEKAEANLVRPAGGAGS